ncbi:hypothetical protein D3C87_2084120 [compost metagenome]
MITDIITLLQDIMVPVVIMVTTDIITETICDIITTTVYLITTEIIEIKSTYNVIREL